MSVQTEKVSVGRKERKKKNFFVRTSEVKKAFSAGQLMILLVFKEAALLSNTLKDLPGPILSLLEEFEDVVTEEMPGEMQSIRDIEHRINFVHGAF